MPGPAVFDADNASERRKHQNDEVTGFHGALISILRGKEADRFTGVTWRRWGNVSRLPNSLVSVTKYTKCLGEKDGGVHWSS